MVCNHCCWPWKGDANPLDFAIEADRSLIRRIGAFEDKIEDMKDRVREEKRQQHGLEPEAIFTLFRWLPMPLGIEDNDCASKTMFKETNITSNTTQLAIE